MTKKILLVEDNEDLSFVIKKRLEGMKKGYEVLQAEDGESGIKLWREQHPDIIVTDVDMPRMDGWEMVRRIRLTDTRTPIIYTSHLCEETNYIKGIRTGADNYLGKPFKMEKLEAAIFAMLRRANGTEAGAGADVHRLGIFRFKPASCTLTDTRTGQTHHLGVMPGKVLEMLVMKSNDIVLREALLQEVWNNNHSEKNLNNVILSLRTLLKTDTTLEIVTYRNIGYQLTVKP